MKLIITDLNASETLDEATMVNTAGGWSWLYQFAYAPIHNPFVHNVQNVWGTQGLGFEQHNNRWMNNFLSGW